ncbi:M16 family metallopeptidase [Coralloluteibacterium stylophorae]|uniref:Insulinase family protein n=1 Tax=Coralloluteibacterium stylophorae TaxID=1776034 RepID=A0A8J8AXB2_9GAMM|nr:pitrilysin family protein [Coralloluteibacterium stylophorae]MBS7457451.1 insulinase family protein [Coralloluteibacterium stylophorae]
MTHFLRRTRTAALLALALAAPLAVRAADVDIPYETFTLPNGLRVVVHTDRKAPIVAVNVWYHVGAKNEYAGKTGFAHLFEHLMFQGTENYQGEYFAPFEQVGATNMNGTTNSDRTNYFENVPTTALDLALWMESDRMGHFIESIDQADLDEQRGVVQNEKRQGENQPYGRVWERLAESSYPAGHPYSWTTIGSMADLDAASLGDVKNWFRAWYGPNNAVLVLAGDIDVETARKKVARYFGDIPAGPTLAQPEVDPAPRTGSTRETMTDRVAQARIYRVWNVPEFGDGDFDRLRLFANVLGGSKASRLDGRLVHDERIADSVSAMAYDGELGSTFMMTADVKDGVDPAVVEKALDEELQRLLREGPTQAELDRAKAIFQSGFVHGVERIGGFGGKADVLAECAVFTGDPGCFRTRQQTIAEADLAAVGASARRWLGQGDHTLVVVPGAQPPAPVDGSTADDPAMPQGVEVIPQPDVRFTTLESDVDRSKGPPLTAEFPDLKFPELQRTTLSNGIPVILAERHEVPVVRVSVEFPGGYAADVGRATGTASFTMGMLEEGAGELDALAFASRTEELGASIGAGAALDGSSAYLSALTDRLDPSLALLADVVQRPRFEADDIARVKATWIAGIAQEKTRPNSIAMRLLPPLLYGQGHPYAIPFTGSGDAASIGSLEREDLVDFQRDVLRPDNATVVVAGDTTLERIVPLLEKHFADWTVPGEKQVVREIPKVGQPASQRVFLVDQPGAIQATIMAGELVPSTMDDSDLPFSIANGVLGGEFSSRLNMNLREDKSWAYGAYSFASSARGQRPWIAFAPVQIDKTAEALAEMRREVAAYATGQAPATEAEIAKIRATNVRGLPGSYETLDAVMSAIGGIVRFERPDDYVVTLKDRIEELSDAEVRETAGLIDPAALTWVVVGDLETIEAPVRALGLGEVVVLDADGNRVR